MAGSGKETPASEGQETSQSRRATSPSQGEEAVMVVGRGEALDRVRSLHQRLERVAQPQRWERPGLRLISRDEGNNEGSSDEEDAKPKETTESGARAGGMQ